MSKNRHHAEMAERRRSIVQSNIDRAAIIEDDARQMLSTAGDQDAPRLLGLAIVAHEIGVSLNGLLRVHERKKEQP